MKRQLIASLAGIVMLAGLGASQVYADPGPGGDGGQHERHGGPGMKWGADLNLTADQQAKIKAIHEKYHPQQGDKGQRGDRQQSMTELKAILAAPNLDQGRLRTLIAKFQEQGPPADMQQKMLSAMAEVRNVLTPEQRTKLADSKGGGFFGMGPGGKGGHGGHGGPGMHGGKGGMGGGLFGMQRLLDEITLTPAQNDGLNQLKTQLKANREAGQQGHDHGPKVKEAMALFWRTGDQGALKAAMTTVKPNLPVDAIVKFVASLDAQQRAQIVARMGDGHGRKNRHDRHGA